MTALASAPIPTNDNEQTLYNTVVETYGTHYVTHVIVGAIAHTYTLIDEAYSKSSTFEEMTTQVTRTGRFLFFSKGSAEESRNIYQSISEPFRKNSNSFSVYQPPIVQTIEGKTEYQ